jgi:hypothetical protein
MRRFPRVVVPAPALLAALAREACGYLHLQTFLRVSLVYEDQVFPLCTNVRLLDYPVMNLAGYAVQCARHIPATIDSTQRGHARCVRCRCNTVAEQWSDDSLAVESG